MEILFKISSYAIAGIGVSFLLLFLIWIGDEVFKRFLVRTDVWLAFWIFYRLRSERRRRGKTE